MNPFVFGLVMGLTLPATSAVKENISETANSGAALFWQYPGNLASRDLFYGPGGREHQPHPPYTFVKEDMEGTNPKFEVRDRDGVKWKVKLGVEARPETVATRLVWAAGYFANEDYFLPEMRVDNMPAHLHRGQKLVARDGSVHNVRLKREDEKKMGAWRWRQNPFTGTREWNGLRVMMALLNNWDPKDTNNAVYRHDSESVYVVSDLGATFGTTAANLPLSKAKGNFESYSHSKFIRRFHATTVDFYVPGRPEILYLFHPRDYFTHVHLEWIGKNIPRQDAHWIGSLLSQLSHRQVEDAFRAAGYSPQEVEGFSGVVERRIALLTEL